MYLSLHLRWPSACPVRLPPSSFLTTQSELNADILISRFSSYCRNTIFLRSNNIHAFSISEPCILPVFCKAIQTPKTLIYNIYICFIVVYIYIYMYIKREYRQDIVQNFHFNPTPPTLLCHFTFNPQPSIPSPFL